MTSPATGNPSPAPSSSSSQLDVYLFNCGHGDTILIRLLDKRWGMVDCYLPEAGGVRDRFFAFVRNNQIPTLEFIFQTHPDFDHFHGMEAVIEYFVTSSQKIGRYYDSGLNAVWASHLLYRSPARTEYLRLQERLEEWAGRGDVREWSPLTAERYPISTQSGMSKINFVPLAPDPADHRRTTTADLRRLAANPTSRAAANPLSLVIALSAESGGRTFNALLGADAGIEGLEKALVCWSRYCTAVRRPESFNALKIPHDGSKHSHHPRICNTKSPDGKAVAGVSAGVREALPDRFVLAAYLDAGWSVVSTTTRGWRRAALSLPMELADRSVTPPGPQSHLIHLSWEPITGLSVEPQEAAVTREDLAHYETARS